MSNQSYEIVISGGRVMDPESGLDAVRNIGISSGSVVDIAEAPLRGRDAIDATGLVVAPGFVDLHCHGLRPEQDAIQVRDGVTTGLELEVGAADIDSWYAAREGASLINYGASAGHIPVRMAHFGDSGDFLPVDVGAYSEPTDEDVAEIRRRVEAGLRAGAPAVGLGMQYTPSASRWEVLEVFRAAARIRRVVPRAHARRRPHRARRRGRVAAGGHRRRRQSPARPCTSCTWRAPACAPRPGCCR